MNCYELYSKLFELHNYAAVLSGRFFSNDA